MNRWNKCGLSGTQIQFSYKVCYIYFVALGLNYPPAIKLIKEMFSWLMLLFKKRMRQWIIFYYVLSSDFFLDSQIMMVPMYNVHYRKTFINILKVRMKGKVLNTNMSSFTVCHCNLRLKPSTLHKSESRCMKKELNVHFRGTARHLMRRCLRK